MVSKYVSSIVGFFSYPGGGNGKQRDIAHDLRNGKVGFLPQTEMFLLVSDADVPTQEQSRNNAPVHAPCSQAHFQPDTHFRTIRIPGAQ